MYTLDPNLAMHSAVWVKFIISSKTSIQMLPSKTASSVHELPYKQIPT